jgi:hypothetical protein
MFSTRTVLRSSWVAALVAVALLAGCGDTDSADTDGNSALVEMVRYSREDSSVPPEFHTSDRVELADGVLTRTSFAEYEQVVVEERSRELTEAELEELAAVVVAADLNEIDKIDDNCDGVALSSFSVEWSDGEAVSGQMDSRTFGGEPGRCRVQSIEGDVRSIVTHLYDIDIAEAG